MTALEGPLVCLPTLANGKVCYIPATDISRSSDFYQRVFGWSTRKRGDGSVAFDDGAGEVNDVWVSGRPPAKTNFLSYVMIESVAATLAAIVVNGGEIMQPIGVDAPEVTARFHGPAGLYQQPT